MAQRSQSRTDDFVVKPIDPAQLDAALRRTISGVAQRSASPGETAGDGEKKETMTVTG